MYLMYVDESGDCGLVNSPTRYFVLTGLVVHELRWQTYLNELVKFRHSLKQIFGIKLREEIHAASLITRPGNLVRMKRQDRLAVIRAFADVLSAMNDLNVVNVVVDKQNKTIGYDVFGSAWRALIQRFENTISKHNFPGPANPDDRGFILCDHTDDKKLTQLQRRLHQYNPVPNQADFEPGYRNLPLHYIIEDPVFRDSRHSYYIQAADLAAFLLYQHLDPNVYMRKKAGHNYFYRLSSIFCQIASSGDPDGIVRI